jgi:hypothetical protein
MPSAGKDRRAQAGNADLRQTVALRRGPEVVEGASSYWKVICRTPEQVGQNG